MGSLRKNLPVFTCQRRWARENQSDDKDRSRGEKNQSQNLRKISPEVQCGAWYHHKKKKKKNKQLVNQGTPACQVKKAKCRWVRRKKRAKRLKTPWGI